MARFNVHDFDNIERSPTSPYSLRNKINSMLNCSTYVRAKVDSVNPDTGEYRIVLQGTLEKEDTKWEE